ncbi:MAG: hypothetical protein H7Z42_05535 [Roseiflexaceae bacterium]|nr:hypothetical protein [Roseiflexaceae bacterium]
MALPQTVSPGQLITADLINEILAALRGYQNLSTNFSTLSQAVTSIDTRVKNIEALVKEISGKNNENRGVIDSLRIDRDDLRIKIDALNGQVIPGLRGNFNRIEAALAERIEPFERRMNEVELRVVRDTDPIDRVSGISSEYVNLLRGRGIESVADLRANVAEIPNIIGNSIDALRIGTIIERIR